MNLDYTFKIWTFTFIDLAQTIISGILIIG